MTVRFCLNTVV